MRFPPRAGPVMLFKAMLYRKHLDLVAWLRLPVWHATRMRRACPPGDGARNPKPGRHGAERTERTDGRACGEAGGSRDGRTGGRRDQGRTGHSEE